MNGEIKSAIGKILHKKDQYQIAMQSQLGYACSALGTAITKILGNGEGGDTTLVLKEVFELLCESGVLMADLHHEFSKTRRAFITPALRQKIAHNVAVESKVDTYLYGEQFPEKLKAAKEIERSSKDLLKPERKPDTAKGSSRPPFKPRNDLNFRGPFKRRNETSSRQPRGHTNQSRGRPRSYRRR